MVNIGQLPLLSNMAEGHEILSSSISNIEPSRCKAEIAGNVKYDESIIKKNLKLAWTGDVESMKRLVPEFLEPEGVWKSVVSDKKVFYSGNSECISWRKNQKLIQEIKFYGLKTKASICFFTCFCYMQHRYGHRHFI